MKLTQNPNHRIARSWGDFPLEVDSLFDHVFGPVAGNPRSAPSGTWTPRVTIQESESGYQMLAELPGVDPDSISLELNDNQLELSGTKPAGELADGFQVLRDERLHGDFKRIFEFGQQVDADRIEASLDGGLLTIELPKSESVLPRKIEVKFAK